MNFCFFFAVEYLDFGGEGAGLPLVVPLVGPLPGADVPEDAEEVLARLVFLSLHLGATVVVNIVLPAVSATRQKKLTI